MYRDRWGYYFILPNVLLVVVFTLIPIIWSCLLSFQEYMPMGSKWIGLGNYVNVCQDLIFWRSMKNTIYYTVGVVPLGLALCMLLAVLIFPLRKGWQIFFKASLYLPGVTSGAVLALIWVWLFNPAFGLLNYLLSLVGLGPVMWLADARTAMPSIMLMSIVSGLGSTVILYLAALGGIPSTLYEAADIDGADAWVKFFRITLPLLKPTTLYALVMNTIYSFQVFTQIYMMTRGEPFYATSTVVYRIYETAFERLQFGLASAQAMILFVVIVAMAYLQFKYLSTDVEY